MHPPQHDFVKTVKDKFPASFVDTKVLEVGSLDINGSVRDLFENCEYVGIDVGPGPGVNIIAEGQRFPGPDRFYDVTISCECFEHNPFWLETFFNMWRMTKPLGLIIFTCATHGRPEHGTTRTTPKDSPLTIGKGWEYYRNLSEDDFRIPFNFDYIFKEYKFIINPHWADLYFYGIKNQ